MSIPLPNLDDRNYPDLVEEAQSLIPIECPEWTDRNPSDTGIVLIELLAWLTEMTLYQVNQVGNRNYQTFLNLLKGSHWDLPSNLVDPDEIEAAIHAETRQTILKLRRRYRAITIEDFEGLILQDWSKSHLIKRVKFLEQRNLESTDKQAEFPGHISLVIVPDNQQVKSEKITELNQNLKTWLTPRTLLTTRLHIVPPNYVEFKIAADLYLEDGADRYTVETNAINAINTFYHPLNSSPDWDGKGWPFGRNIYVSEIYALLDKISGIDYVKNVKVYLPNPTNEDKSNTCITVEDYQLVSVIIDENSFTFKDRFGNEWQ